MDFSFDDKKTQAIEMASAAYAILKQAGIPEEFLPILQSVAHANRGTFFGSFGSDSGCFIEFEQTDDPLMPAKMSFGVRQYRPGFWKRAKDAWLAFHGHDAVYSIELRPEDIMKLKDLLRVLR